MELIPSERVVLKQVRQLFVEASVRTYRVTTLTARWPAAHFDAYKIGYVGLVKKGLISATRDNRFFTITNAGLRAMA